MLYTMPTDLERTAISRRSLNTQGALRTIYDPFTTQTNGNVVTRQPFAGNVIPANRIDSDLEEDDGRSCGSRTARAPARRASTTSWPAMRTGFKYWNFSDRVDWNINDKWKVFGRYNQFRTFTKWDDFTGGALAQPVDGSKRHSTQLLGRHRCTRSMPPRSEFPRRLQRDCGFLRRSSGDADGGRPREVLAGQAWYKPYLADLPDIYYPGHDRARRRSNTALGKTGYWFQEPKSWNIESKMSKNIGRHYIKVGGEFRQRKSEAARPRPMSFDFRPDLTADTY